MNNSDCCYLLKIIIRVENYCFINYFNTFMTKIYKCYSNYDYFEDFGIKINFRLV